MSAVILALSVIALSAAVIAAGAVMAQPNPDTPGWVLMTRVLIVWMAVSAVVLLLGLAALAVEVSQ